MNIHLTPVWLDLSDLSFVKRALHVTLRVAGRSTKSSRCANLAPRLDVITGLSDCLKIDKDGSLIVVARPSLLLLARQSQLSTPPPQTEYDRDRQAH